MRLPMVVVVLLLLVIGAVGRAEEPEAPAGPVALDAVVVRGRVVRAPWKLSVQPGASDRCP